VGVPRHREESLACVVLDDPRSVALGSEPVRVDGEIVGVWRRANEKLDISIWQRLTPAEMAQFFDARTLFDPQAGLFSAMRDTQAPSLGSAEKINGHDTYPVTGAVTAGRMHQLLTLIRDQGSYHATYWIESPANTLWRARLSGNLFDPTRPATVTFDFSNHDHPVSVTPPPLG